MAVQASVSPELGVGWGERTPGDCRSASRLNGRPCLKGMGQVLNKLLAPSCFLVLWVCTNAHMCVCIHLHTHHASQNRWPPNITFTSIYFMYSRALLFLNCSDFGSNVVYMWIFSNGHKSPGGHLGGGHPSSLLHHEMAQWKIVGFSTCEVLDLIHSAQNKSKQKSPYRRPV